MDLTIKQITDNLVHGTNVSFLHRNRDIENAKIVIEKDKESGLEFVFLAQNEIATGIENVDKLGYNYLYSIGWKDDLRLNVAEVKITRIGELNKIRNIEPGMKLKMRGFDFVVFNVHMNIVFLALPDNLEEVVRKHDIKLVLKEATFED